MLRFPEDRILTKQVELIYKNFPPGLCGYLVICTLNIVILKPDTTSTAVIWWLLICYIVGGTSLFRCLSLKNKQIESPRREATLQVFTLFLLGLLWAYIPIGFLDGEKLEVSIWIISITTGLGVSSLAMQSPSLSTFLAFFIPSVSSLMIAFVTIGTELYITLAICLFIYLAALILMAINLESTFTESIVLRHANDELISQLQGALQETKEANKSKSVFLASASHDLRQPIHAMGLFVETLIDTPLSQQQESAVDNLHLAIGSTRTMLNTLLDFSKLDAGAIQPKSQAFLVQTVFSKLENELAPEADERGLIYRTRETTQAAYGDPLLLELILRNLVANAIRYTLKGGLLVGCRQLADGELSLEVWDSGIGIEKQDQQHIFKEFHQLGNPERDREKGFGLGLANARGLAKAMDLNISVDSKLGRGSVFKLRVPGSTVSIIEDIPSGQINTDLLVGKQVLFVDDDKPIRLAMQSLLESWDCVCMAAESIDQALLEYGDKSIDLLIVDYRLQDNVTGKDVIERLRAHFANDLPAIIVTGDTASDRIIEAKSVDALLLHKPTSSAQLQHMMSILLT